MPLHFVYQDITSLRVEAIVNAANTGLAQGGGVCGAIFEAAGPEELTRACRAIGRCETGKAVITPGFRLCKWIIHTPGPVFGSCHGKEMELLQSCYRESLRLAAAHGIHSIAFPLISAGIFGCPPVMSAEAAVREIRRFLLEEDKEDMEVWVAILGKPRRDRVSPLGRYLSELPEPDPSPYDVYIRYSRRETDAMPCGGGAMPCGAGAMPEAEADEPRPNAAPKAPPRRAGSAPAPAGAAPSMPKVHIFAEEDSSALSRMLRSDKPGESFSHMLLRLIDERNEKDSDVYKRANIDRRHFSRIRSREDYQPGKGTVMAFCLALRLDQAAADQLMRSAGYSFSDASRRDRAVCWCISHGEWDVFSLNMTLSSFGLPMLGAV